MGKSAVAPPRNTASKSSVIVARMRSVRSTKLSPASSVFRVTGSMSRGAARNRSDAVSRITTAEQPALIT